MIVLYAAGASFGLPEISPYVAKTEVQLKMAGLAYRKEIATPATAPKGKLPYIDDAGERVADSTFIRAHLEQKYGVDLDAGLDRAERAQSWALERLLEDHLGWATTHARWMLPQNFERGPARWFDQAPAEQRDGLKSALLGRVSDALRVQGIGRHTLEEVTDLGGRSLWAASVLLADKPYLMGERPTAVDATAFAMLAGLLTPWFDSPLRRRAEALPNLPAYVERMMGRYYPEHPWTPLLAAAA